jgi:hypothetical protein
MSQINLQINFNPKVVVAAFLALGAIALVQKIPETKAQASSALTGKFACITNANALPFLTAKNNQTAFISSLAIIDFDTNASSSTITYVTRFNTNAASQQSDEVSGTFTVASGPITGTYTITFSVGGVYVFAPVNSGNTALFKTKELGDAMPETGVCQKI